VGVALAALVTENAALRIESGGMRQPNVLRGCACARKRRRERRGRRQYIWRVRAASTAFRPFSRFQPEHITTTRNSLQRLASDTHRVEPMVCLEVQSRCGPWPESARGARKGRCAYVTHIGILTRVLRFFYASSLPLMQSKGCTRCSLCRRQTSNGAVGDRATVCTGGIYTGVVRSRFSLSLFHANTLFCFVFLLFPGAEPV
jgi:hypothetical protein